MLIGHRDPQYQVNLPNFLQSDKDVVCIRKALACYKDKIENIKHT